jgi:hypothetical protein
MERHTQHRTEQMDLAVPAGLFIFHCPTQDSVPRTASWAEFRVDYLQAELGQFDPAAANILLVAFSQTV